MQKSTKISAENNSKNQQYCVSGVDCDLMQYSEQFKHENFLENVIINGIRALVPVNQLLALTLKSVNVFSASFAIFFRFIL